MTPIVSYAPPKRSIYPESDGEPIAENTLQFDWIQKVAGGLRALYKRRADVFVAGDLLWYPVEGEPTIRVAPDAMVVFGRPAGYRGSYLQWREDNVPPHVVFEILSPGNRTVEMLRKFGFYNKYGVEEYYIYDPESNKLDGYIRRGYVLEDIEQINGWRSPRLGVRFNMDGDELVIEKPDGAPLLTYVEADEQREFAQAHAKVAIEAQLQAERFSELAMEAAAKAQANLTKAQADAAEAQADAAEAQADAAEAQADAAKAQADAAKAQADAAKAEAERTRAISEKTRLEEKLRALGIDPDA